MLAMLIGCGLRRGELLALRVDSIQVHEEHWVSCRSPGQGRAHSCSFGPEVGEGYDRRMEGGQWCHGRCTLSVDTSDRQGLGSGDDAEGAVGDSA
jgi:hypothetical protein